MAPVIEELRAAGAVSLRALAEGLNARGVPTARGGEWSAGQVARVVAGVGTVGKSAQEEATTAV